jgi:ATP-dependent Lhr-like helicase
VSREEQTPETPENGEDRSATAALRELMPHAWYGFLARFGAPRPIQREAARVLLEGQDALLLAPTAGGKTEAWGAPVAEHILAAREQGEECGLAWFVVCPTRALVNDLARRLERPCDAVGLRLGRRTGEHRELGGDRPSHLVITTPESLDSMLARSPARLTGLRHLVLDEIHLLHSSPRGDQLGCLVSRLRRLAPGVQVVASSATVDDPQGLAARYLAESHRTVSVDSERSIRARILRGGTAALRDTLAHLAARDVHKVLAFVPRRADAERLCGVFRGRPPFGAAVYLHHGSLSRARRETVERQMLTGDTGLCFATSTLEVGIDIGDIDLVVMTAPPPDVASFLQRLGRGNRRTSASRVICLADGEGQALRYEHLLAAARQGRLLEDPRPFSPGVLVQQAFSLLKQSGGGWISAERLAERLPPSLAEEPWQGRLPELLTHLRDHDWLVGGPRRYHAGERLEASFERGRIHGNIDEEAAQVSVVDRDSRQVIGLVPRRAAREGRLRLGGRRLRVTDASQPDRILVTDTRHWAELVPGGRAGPLVPHRLARDLAHHAGLDRDTAPTLPLPDGCWAVLHLLGGRWAAALRVIHAERGTEGISTINAFAAVTAGDPEAVIPAVEEAALEALLRAHAGALGQRLPLGPWARELPRSWRTDHVVRWLDPPALARALTRLRVVVDPEAVPERWRPGLADLVSVPRSSRS